MTNFIVTVSVVDFLGSAGLVCLCAAVLDQFIFKFILALTIFCAIGFLLTTIWCIAESVVYRHYKGSKWFRDILSTHWMRTKELLPARIAIKVGDGILSLVIFIWRATVDIMVRGIESAKLFLPHRGRRDALIPMAINNTWRILGVWANGPPTVGIKPDHLELVHDEERRVVDLRAEVREEKEKNSAHFWHQERNAEEVCLRMVTTHAHLGVIRYGRVPKSRPTSISPQPPGIYSSILQVLTRWIRCSRLIAKA